MTNSTFSSSQRITNTLLLNASFIENLGLMHGKMGISVFFFHLAKQTKNQIYEDYAGELIDEIYEEITANTPVDFENGLAGIGWGIEYLVQNGFIEADTDEVLEEFDNRIFKELIYNTPKDIGLLNGLLGIGAYFLKRIQNPASNDEKILTLTNKQTLIHLIDELDRRTQDITSIIKEPGDSDILHKEPTPIFDITWNYSALLLLLAELYQQNIFNFKVEKIILRLIQPLLDGNFPNLKSNQLLLYYSISNLKLADNSFNQLSNSLFKDLLLKTDLNESSIKSKSIRNGTSGIEWLCVMIKKDRPDLNIEQIITPLKNDLGVDEIKFTDISQNKNFGLLEGIAGDLFASELA